MCFKALQTENVIEQKKKLQPRPSRVKKCVVLRGSKLQKNRVLQNMGVAKTGRCRKEKAFQMKVDKSLGTHHSNGYVWYSHPTRAMPASQHATIDTQLLCPTCLIHGYMDKFGTQQILSSCYHATRTYGCYFLF